MQCAPNPLNALYYDSQSRIHFTLATVAVSVIVNLNNRHMHLLKWFQLTRDSDFRKITHQNFRSMLDAAQDPPCNRSSAGMFPIDGDYAK